MARRARAAFIASDKNRKVSLGKPKREKQIFPVEIRYVEPTFTGTRIDTYRRKPRISTRALGTNPRAKGTNPRAKDES